MGRARFRAGTRRPGPAERAAGAQSAVLTVVHKPAPPKTTPLIVQANGADRYKCKGCFRTLRTKGAFTTHMKACVRYGCTRCGQLFPSDAALRGHTSGGSCRCYTSRKSRKRSAGAKHATLRLSDRDAQYGFPREYIPPQLEDCYVFIQREVTLDDLSVAKAKSLSSEIIASEAESFVKTCQTLIRGRKRDAPSFSVLKEHKTYFSKWINRMSLECRSRSIRTCYLHFHSTLQAQLDDIKSLYSLYKLSRVAFHVNLQYNDIYFDQVAFEDAETVLKNRKKALARVSNIVRSIQGHRDLFQGGDAEGGEPTTELSLIDRITLRNHSLHACIGSAMSPSRVLQCVVDSIVPQRKETFQYLRHCIPTVKLHGDEIRNQERYYITFRPITYSYVIIMLENKTTSSVVVLELPVDLNQMLGMYLDTIDTIVFPSKDGGFLSDGGFSKLSPLVKWKTNRARHAMSNYLDATHAPMRLKQSVAIAMSTSLKTLHGHGHVTRRVDPSDGVGSYLTSYTRSNEAHIATTYVKSLLMKQYMGFFFVVKLRGETTIGKVLSVSNGGVALFVRYELAILDHVVVLQLPGEMSKCVATIDDVNKVTSSEFVLKGLHAPIYSDEYHWHWNLLMDQVKAFLPCPKVILTRGLRMPSEIEVFVGQIIKVDDCVAEVRGVEESNLVYMPLTLVGDGEWSVQPSTSVARVSRNEVSLILEWYYTTYGNIKLR